MLPILFLLHIGCVHAPTAAVATPITQPAALTAPPFTMDELRAAFPVGSTLRLRVRKAGAPEVEQRWHITAADASGMTIASTVHAADGTLLQDEGEETSTWAELQTHGQFPAATTTREDSVVEVPAGKFDTWLYTVVDAEHDTISRYHFAKTLPGPPVLFTIQAGKATIFEMTLIERE